MPQLFSAKILITILVLTILDLCLTPLFGIARPLLAYLLVVFAILEGAEIRKIGGLALLTGVLRDFSGIEPLGVETFILSSTAIVFAFITSKIEHESVLTRTGIVFLFVFFVCMIRLALGAFITGSNAVPTQFLFLTLLSSFSTAMISPAFLWLLKGWLGRRSFLKQYELFK